MITYTFEENGSTITCEPEKRLIRVWFAKFNGDKESTEQEALWARETILNNIFAKYTGTPFFTILDVTNKGSSEFVSRSSMKIYGELGEHPQSDELVHVGTNPMIREIIKIIRLLVESKKNFQPVKSIEQAEKLHAKWLKKNTHKTVSSPS